MSSRMYASVGVLPSMNILFPIGVTLNLFPRSVSQTEGFIPTCFATGGGGGGVGVRILRLALSALSRSLVAPPPACAHELAVLVHEVSG